MYRQGTQGIGWLLWVDSTDSGWSFGFGGFSALGPADPYFYFLPFSMKIDYLQGDEFEGCLDEHGGCEINDRLARAAGAAGAAGSRKQQAPHPLSRAEVIISAVRSSRN